MPSTSLCILLNPCTRSPPVKTLLSHVYLSIPVYTLYSYPGYFMYTLVFINNMYTLRHTVYLCIPTQANQQWFPKHQETHHSGRVNGIKFPHSLSHTFITHSLVNSSNPYCSYTLFVFFLFNKYYPQCQFEVVPVSNY